MTRSTISCSSERSSSLIVVSKIGRPGEEARWDSLSLVLGVPIVAGCLRVVLLIDAIVGLLAEALSAEESLYSGVLCSAPSSPPLRSLVTSLPRTMGGVADSWPQRPGCCRLRVVIRIAPEGLHELARVEVPLCVPALRGAIVSVVGIGNIVWGARELGLSRDLEDVSVELIKNAMCRKWIVGSGL